MSRSYWTRLLESRVGRQEADGWGRRQRGGRGVYRSLWREQQQEQQQHEHRRQRFDRRQLQWRQHEQRRFELGKLGFERRQQPDLATP